MDHNSKKNQKIKNAAQALRKEPEKGTGLRNGSSEEYLALDEEKDVRELDFGHE